MANDIKLDSLAEQVNTALATGGFVVFSLAVTDSDAAIEKAKLMGMEADKFDEGTVKVSRMGVNAVELQCGDAAKVILSWQGTRPDAATNVDDEDDDNESDED